MTRLLYYGHPSLQPHLNGLIVESRFINHRGICTEKVKPFASESFNPFSYFGHCAHINKLVYYIYFSSFVNYNLLIL